MDERLYELRAALQEDPSSRLFYQLGELLRRDGGYHEAVRVLRAGLDHHPRYVAAWVALGRAHAALDQYAEAEEAFARALEIDPENAVAAWGIGESAGHRGDWVRSVKALKLARALSPRDDRLESAIEEAEDHLAESGLLEPARPVAAVEAGLTTVPAARIQLPRPQLVELAEGDPFEVGVRGDTGVWMLGEDVFELPAPEPETPEWELEEEGAAPPVPLPASEPEPDESGWELEEGGPGPVHEAALPEGDHDWELGEPDMVAGQEAVEVAPEAAASTWELDEPTPPSGIPVGSGEEEEVPPPAEAAPEVDWESELAVDLAEVEAPTAEAPHWTAPEAVDFEPSEEEVTAETGWDPVEEIPLPTYTLARLAYDQGDLQLAERTLLGLLRRQPDSDEARELLDRVRAELRGPGEAVEAYDLSAAKVAALRGWMEAIRLASEQSRT